MLGRRVPPGSIEYLTQGHQFRPIHAHRFDSCSANRRQADYHRRVRGPCEVILPQLFPGMKQGRHLSRKRVGGILLCILMTVASLARKRQVILFSGPASGTRDDMLNGKGLRRKARLAAAVFANASRPFVNKLPEPFDASGRRFISHESFVVGKLNAELLHHLGQSQAAQRGQTRQRSHPRGMQALEFMLEIKEFRMFDGR